MPAAPALLRLAAALLGCGALALTVLAGSRDAQDDLLESYREPARRLIAESTSTDFAWQRLAELTDTFGHRLSGSRALEEAIAWAAREMTADGLDAVRLDPVTVPHWVRGRESAEVTLPRAQPLAMLGLGDSVGTPPEGLEAELLVVSSFAELESQRERVGGRIVLYNVPFTRYGDTVQYRSDGASRAAAHGAVAVLVRSIGPPGLRTPHTGALRYTAGHERIPAAAISTEDADLLQRLQDRGTPVRVRLRMEARFLPDAQSFNVIGEIRGRERPHEVVVVGGHLDSWDVGAGANDDAVGCIVTWEALRLLKKAGLQPRRTLRVVLFTNEENGLRGALDYRDRYRDELADHVLMLESDSGLLEPVGFGFSGSEAARQTVRRIATLLEDIGMSRIGPTGGGADIGPSVQAAAIPAMSIETTGNYFLIHHTDADTVDKIEPADVARAAAGIAVMAYVIADMPERLPR